MLHFITVENGLPYFLLWKILIETINKSVKIVLRHRILIYFKGNFFQSGISSYNKIMSSGVLAALKELIHPLVLRNKPSTIVRSFVLLSAHVKAAVYTGMVMQTRAVCK